MLIPFEWLKELIDFDTPLEDVAHTLTMCGLEVEGVQEQDGDHVLEVNVTPNRPDCLSVIGVGREFSAVTGLPLKFPEYETYKGAKSDFQVEISDKDLCRRYTGMVIKGVTIAESPKWLKSRLDKCGLRSINNIVDITNYVLLELGHPLHAFDLDTLKGGTIRVAKAGKRKEIITLDAVQRSLPEDALCIFDAERPVAVAGVMGGAETEVTASTTNIFLESAWFQPGSVRRTSKALALQSESSYRFERGADILMAETAIKRTAHLIKTLCGGEVQELIDIYPGKFSPPAITLKPEKVTRLLGIEISNKEISDILKRLNIAVVLKNKVFTLTPPSYRPDLLMDTDMIEEIARLYGYNNIPSETPRAGITSQGLSTRLRLIAAIKESIRMLGYNEVINMSFMNPGHLDTLGIPKGDTRRNAVELRNPLKKEDPVLRTTLLPSLLESFTYNFHRDIRDICMYELSRVFETSVNSLPNEPVRLAGIYYRERGPSLWAEQAEDFFVVKGDVESLLGELSVEDFTFAPSLEPFLHPGKSADLFIGKERAGFIGVLSPLVVERLSIKPRADIVVFELDVDTVLGSVREAITYKSIPKFPFIERDLAILLDQSFKAAHMLSLINAYPSEFIEEASVFDTYSGKGIPEGKKSLAFTVRYRASDRTLTDEEVEAIHEGLIKHIKKQTGGEIRGTTV